MNFDFSKLMQFGGVIAEIEPLIKNELIPIIEQWESTQKLSEGEKIIHSLSFTSDKVYLYGFSVNTDFKITKELYRVDLIEKISQVKSFLPDLSILKSLEKL